MLELATFYGFDHGIPAPRPSLSGSINQNFACSTRPKEDSPMRVANWGRVTIMSLAAVIGAATGAAAQSKATEAQVTFTKDVAPILQRSCQACHRPNNIAPMSLLTYEEARPWARSIKARV